MKRMAVVFFITFVFIAITQQFLFKKADEQKSPSAQKQEQQQQQPAAPQQSAAVVPAPQAPAASAKQATAETETVIENDLYRIAFTNKGAQVKSWVLKKYKDERGNPLELVHTAAAQQWGYPLSFWTWDQGLKDKLNTAMYVADATGQVAAPRAVNFEFADGDVTVRKSFTFDHSYLVKIETSVTRGGTYVTALPAWPAGFGDATVPASYHIQTIDYHTGADIERVKLDDVSGGNVLRGPITFGGAVDQYFAAIFLPDKPQNAVLATLRNQIEIAENPSKADSKKTQVEVLGAASGEMNAPTSTRLFVGPKDLDVVQAVHANGVNGESNAGPDLRETVDFGIFAFIARPLFLWLKWTQQHMIPNWGWAIVFLTVVINLVLLPLRISTMKSALRMQKIAPQIKAIQDKYKGLKMTDPKRQNMNAEVAAIYKQHNVNPAGGCLPMLIQMPFLFAFYAMLASAIEMRQAKWLWLNDLSSPDRLFLIPIAIVATMIVLQKMTPTAGISPEQQRMMNIMMPMMIGLMSWSVASGLGLYWVTGTIVSIIQQMIMNRTELGQEIRAVAEKRAARKR